MTRTAHAAALAAGLVAVVAVAPAAAGPVAVRVIEVAGEVAYLEPGASAGLHRGARVTIAGRDVTVLEVTATAAAIPAGEPRLAVGERGTATVEPGPGPGGPAAATLPPVRPPETWVAQWPDAVLPATGQQPTPRPLGGARAGRVSAALALHGAGHATRDGDVSGALDARGQLAVELWPARDVWVDLDLSGRAFTAGRSGARTPVVVHAARLRLGPEDEPRLEAGRLPWVGAQLGALDGVHARYRVGSLVVGGFAGLLPGDLDTQPRPSATRFGAELGWDDPGGRWQPRVALTAVGSTWDGRLDERRLLVDADVARGALRGRAWGEAQAFAADNPWGAGAIELAAAGASVGWWRRGRHLDVDVSYQRPERSLRLAANLPIDWLCQGTSASPEAGCADATWTDVAASAGASGTRWSIDGSVDVGLEQASEALLSVTGFVLGELRGPAGARVQLGAGGGHARFVDWYGVEAGVALRRRRWDAALRWRPELIAYTGALDRVWQQGVLAEGRWLVGARLSLSGSILATTGADRDAVTGIATLAWRPLP